MRTLVLLFAALSAMSPLYARKYYCDRDGRLYSCSDQTNSTSCGWMTPVVSGSSNARCDNKGQTLNLLPAGPGSRVTDRKLGAFLADSNVESTTKPVAAPPTSRLVTVFVDVSEVPDSKRARALDMLAAPATRRTPTKAIEIAK